MLIAGGLPRMLRDIVEQALAEVDGVQLVGTTGAGDLTAAIRAHNAAFVIVDADRVGAREIAATARACPGRRLLAITGDGRSAALYEMRPHRRALGELSPERLAAIIREHTLVAS